MSNNNELTNIKYLKEKIISYYSDESEDLFYIRGKDFQPIINDLPFRYSIMRDGRITVYSSSMFPMYNGPIAFSAEGTQEIIDFTKKAQKDFIARKMIQFSDLENLIQRGCISYTQSFDGRIIPDKSKPLFYTESELKYCIKKYGTWKVFKSKFKYNFKQKAHFFVWWICNLFGIQIYTKNDINEAIIEVCAQLQSPKALPQIDPSEHKQMLGINEPGGDSQSHRPQLSTEQLNGIVDKVLHHPRRRPMRRAISDVSNLN